MALYRYKARDDSGKILQGTLETASESSAVAQLDSLHYVPIAVKRISGRKTFKKPLKRVPERTLIVFTRQLSTMVQSGIPIITGLNALIEETDNDNFKDILSRIKDDIQEGISLSEAFSKHPQVFSRLYISTIAAGEAGGVLDIVLRRLAELLEHEAETKAAVKSALRYPIMVILSITTAFFVLTTMVVPKFAAIYAASGVPLPVPTRILIAVNYVVRNYWHFSIIGIILVFSLARIYIRTEKGNYQWDYLKLKLPIFGELFIKSICSRFAQMLQTLANAGLPILRSLEVVALTLGNSVFAKEIGFLRSSVIEGKGIAEPILESEFFPRLVAHMVAIGERSGALDDMLLSLQRHYDLEVESTIKNLTALIEPVLTIGLGLIILFLALGIFLPMWDLIKAVKGG